MKKALWIVALLTLIACLAVFVGCNALTGSTTNTTDATDSPATEAPETSVTILEEDPAEDTTESFQSVQEATGDFTIETQDGDYTVEGNVYTLTAAGTYTLSGALNGQILVNAGADAEVVIELKGVTITCDFDSPIKVVKKGADKVEISAQKDTENVIKDTRAEKTVDSDDQGEGAISAKCDLKLKGKGVLVVEAGYNNGIHTTKDLEVKNLSLKVIAVNNALKGKDSVTIESGTIVAISTKGDGIKTENTDLSNDKQRGIITISGGTVTVYAAGDGVQASHDAVITDGELTIYTGSYSSYTASSATTTSYKGVKAGNELQISGGTLKIYSFDDGLHADYGTALDNGNTSLGNITITGGNIRIGVYSPEKTTAMGGMVRGGGPGGRSGSFGGFANQQTVTGSDAIHADNTLTVSGGMITVDSAYEGLEATHIVITDGTITVYATDDGINAAQKISGTPSIEISGGYVDVTVPTNGDTDGIDSNGTYTQTGGVVVVRGPGSASGRQGGGAWALDADRTITLSGGTLILFGGMEKTPSASGMTKTICSSSTVSAGTHTVTIGESKYEVTLKNATSGCVVYSASGSAGLK